MSSLKQKSIKAFAWDFSGKIAGQTVSFIISIFLARLLSPSDFGMLAMVNVVIALSASLMDMGLGVALIQRKEVSEEHFGSVFFFNITVGVLLASILFIAAPAVGLFYKNPDLVPIARTMSILFILNSIGNVIRIRQRKELDYAVPTQANLVGASCSGIIGVTMAFNGFGVWSLVTQSLLNPLLSNLYLFYRIRWRPKLIFKWKALQSLWNFGFRMFLSGILDTIFTNADSLVIGKLFSPSILGYYFRARSLNNYVVQYSSGSLMSVLFPAFSKVQDDPAVFRSMVHKAYHLICFLAFIMTGLFFVTGADIIMLLFGPKWQPAIPLFHLIIFTAYGYPLSSILVNIITASGNSRSFLHLEIIKKVFFGLSLSLGFIWGIKGYLIFNAVAYALAVYTNIIFAGRQMHVGQRWFLRMTFPYLLTAGLVSAGLFLLGNLIQIHQIFHLIIFGAIFILMYLGILWLFKADGLLIFMKEMLHFKPVQKSMTLIRPVFGKFRYIITKENLK